MEGFRSENFAPKNLELIETLKKEIRYFRNENKTKTYIIKSLTENQARDHLKETTTPKVRQRDNAIQTELTAKTWPQEEITPENSQNTIKSLPNANGRKSGSNPSLKLNKESAKKKTLIVGDLIVKHIDGWRLLITRILTWLC